jgi:hypothetical protein
VEDILALEQQQQHSLDALDAFDTFDSFDAFVAFPPGAGTNHQYSWTDGFEMIRDTGKPLMLTAYNDSENDAFRDAYWWQHTFETSQSSSSTPRYQINPWASYSCAAYDDDDSDDSQAPRLIPALNQMVSFRNV